MAENITKIIFRQGTDVQRRTANNGAGIIFTSAEPAYCVDTKRLYVGDGSTGGAIPVGMRNLGAVNQLFGTYSGTGYTQEAYRIMTLSGAAVGDIIYDRNTRILYSLTGASTFPPLTSNFVKYDFTVLLNPAQLEFNASSQVQIKNEGVGYNQIASSVAGSGLTKPLVNGPINISVNGVENKMLEQQQGFTILGNPGINIDDVQGIKIFENSVLGRTNTNVLTSVSFNDLLQQANVRGFNGVQNTFNGTTNAVQLSSDVFFVNGTKVNIFKATTIHNTLSSLNAISTTGTIYANNATAIDAGINAITCGNITTRVVNTQGYGVTCGAMTCTSVNTTNGNLTMGTGTIGCAGITCTSVNTTNGNLTMGTGTIGCAGITCTSINTTNGNINAGTGTISCRTLQATGDVIAFFTSDGRLKEDLKKIETPLKKIDSINGYTFNWIPNTNITERKGNDIGLIAQEIKEIIPQAVTLRDNGYYGLDYTKTIPLLVECIKELKQKVEHLENVIQQSN